MPRAYPEPWPQTEAEVRTWRINNGYDFILERLELPEELFKQHHASLDGITLTMVALSALADYYGHYLAEQRLPGSGDDKPPGVDKRRFRELLGTFAPSFPNRVAIPELARALRDASTGKLTKLKPLLGPMLAVYKVAPPPDVRHVDDDPSVTDFRAWCAGWSKVSGLTVPELVFERFDYAGLLFDYYRNSVVHALVVARGREAYPDAFLWEEPGIAFYQNMRDPGGGVDCLDNIRFGFRPSRILELAKDVVAGARAWAHANDAHIFRS
jgi:hypothetical protein